MSTRLCNWGLLAAIGISGLTACSFGPDTDAVEALVSDLREADGVEEASYETGGGAMQGYRTTVVVSMSPDGTSEQIASVLSDIESTDLDGGSVRLSRSDAPSVSIGEATTYSSDFDPDRSAQRLLTALDSGLGEQGTVVINQDFVSVESPDVASLTDQVDQIATNPAFADWMRWRLTSDAEAPGEQYDFSVTDRAIDQDAADAWHAFAHALQTDPSPGIWIANLRLSRNDPARIDVTFTDDSQVPTTEFAFDKHADQVWPSMGKLIDLSADLEPSDLTIGRFVPDVDDAGVNLFAISDGQVVDPYPHLGWGEAARDRQGEAGAS